MAKKNKAQEKGKKPKKRTFEVADGETIEACLQRMNEEGYMPVRRMEEPVFQEVEKDGKSEVIPVSQRISFEGKVK